MNFDRPHRRLNLLTGQWVLVSPHRAKRPWLGQMEKVQEQTLPAHDPGCYLCAGNQRSNGVFNPPYSSTFVFDNDFAALLTPDEHSTKEQPLKGLLTAQPDDGLCRVVCFSPRHDLSLPELSQADVEAVIHTWSQQTTNLGSHEFINYVQVFENKGASMGASNPHPHSQIWSTRHIPNEPQVEMERMLAYRKEHGSCLLCDYLQAERKNGERVVVSNEHFTALVPFWAVWPFETLLVSHRHTGSLTDLTPAEVSSLADIIRQLTTRYDNLFEVTFPYSMGFHQTPTDGNPHTEAHLHAHYYPPLLRSATVRKFMVGFELLSMPQRDLTAETAAARLRELSQVHYKTHPTI
jgi:UDPglucose--hexose-1-phosphate uridylyltransferase